MANKGSITIGGNDDLQLKRAIIEDGMSMLTQVSIEFLSKDRALELKTLVGKPVKIQIDMMEDTNRDFMGTCIEAEYVGMDRAHGLYRLEVRPWLWFLTRTRESRVFQEMSTVDIVQKIIGDYGFSANIEKRLSGSYIARDFCLQYRETDLDFINRLMEEEGIYYFFTHEAGTEKMVLADASGAHKPVPKDDLYKFVENRGVNAAFRNEYIYELSAKESATTGKVTLNDYDFEAPKRDMKVSRAIPKGDHAHTRHEYYDYQGHYRKTGLGENIARVLMEAEAVRHATWTGVGDIKNIGVGQTMKIQEYKQTQGETAFLVTRATHFIQLSPDDDYQSGGGAMLGKTMPFDPENRDAYRCIFEIIPSNLPYRAPLVTPWPEVQGVQTAVVVGPKGEEIYTDTHGRIRIQFHWDRLGKKDEKSSVWVRTMTPWSGKNWGIVAVPRIGQEVVVQFEDGNPDRPIVTGMLYNADTMPPFGLPGNMTQSGVKTNSTKGGGGFNELMFEDKKGDELVRFQAEKDFKQIVKNDASIAVGLEKKDKGDMDMTIHRNLTETLKTGDHSFTIETGSQTIKIKTNKDEEIEGKSDLVVTGNVTETITQGNVKRTVETGDENVTISTGNFALKTSMGKVDVEAMQSITLKVGGNSIVINQMGVTINAMMITIEAGAMLTATSPFTKVNGDSMLILKGGTTLIN